MRAFKEDSVTGERTYSALSWPPSGFEKIVTEAEEWDLTGTVFHDDDLDKFDETAGIPEYTISIDSTNDPAVYNTGDEVKISIRPPGSSYRIYREGRGIDGVIYRKDKTFIPTEPGDYILRHKDDSDMDILFTVIGGTPYAPRIALASNPNGDRFTEGNIISVDIQPTGSFYEIHEPGVSTPAETDNQSFTASLSGVYTLKHTDDPAVFIEFMVLPENEAICKGSDLLAGNIDDAGYWYDNGCWVTSASSTENCDDVCSGISLVCRDSGDTGGADWNDTTGNTACLALNPGASAEGEG